MEKQLLTEREAELAALLPRIEKALCDALKLRPLECCLADGNWAGNRPAVRAEAWAIEIRIGDALKSLQRISQTLERKDIPR